MLFQPRDFTVEETLAMCSEMRAAIGGIRNQDQAFKYEDPHSKESYVKFGILPGAVLNSIMSAEENQHKPTFELNGVIDKRAQEHALQWANFLRKTFPDRYRQCQYVHHEADTRTKIPHANSHFIAFPESAIASLLDAISEYERQHAEEGVDHHTDGSDVEDAKAGFGPELL